MNNLTEKLSALASKGERSLIREILKLLDKGDVISFAGGLPSPESFPTGDISKVTAKILAEEGEIALQYGATEGDKILCEQLALYNNRKGFGIKPENVLPTASSQQALDIIGKMFLDAGDNIVMGLPSYLGAINAFKAYNPNIIGVKHDEKGLSADGLRNVLKGLQAKGERAKFVYLVPDFQNPAGITMPLDRRVEILAIAKEFDLLIIEDSPYCEIRFSGEHQPTFYSLDDMGRVLNLGTFSKVLAPGFRLGWIIASTEILDSAIVVKQTMDLCTSPFIQRIAGRYMEAGYLEANLGGIIDSYGKKAQTMLKAFEEFMPKGVTWTTPEGGLFLFLRLPENIDTEKLLEVAIRDYKVAFVPGVVFHCDGSGRNTMRMNFSYESEETIREGVKRLAEAIKANM